jgi:hypothetical protein
MQDFESEHNRATRLRRTLESLIKRVKAGEKPGPLREQLQVALMISPLSGGDQIAIVACLEEAIRRLNEGTDD